MGVEFSEEVKEALARSKGTGHFLVSIEDGEMKFYPDCFDVVKEGRNRIVLAVRKPEVPGPEKEKLVREVIAKIEPELKASIGAAVAESLMEKPLIELAAMAGATQFKVQRRRGCLWLITDRTEHVL
ncbi:hypothetical protein ES703_10283 [subsurface metagenome]